MEEAGERFPAGALEAPPEATAPPPLSEAGGPASPAVARVPSACTCCGPGSVPPVQRTSVELLLLEGDERGAGGPTDGAVLAPSGAAEAEAAVHVLMDVLPDDPAGNVTGCTKLFAAAVDGNVAKVRRLIEADPGGGWKEDRDDQGGTVLHWAATGANPKVVALLVDLAPELVLLADTTGLLPTHEAAGHECDAPAAGRAAAALELLLAVAPSTANARDHLGERPLLKAAIAGSVPACRLLLAAAGPGAAAATNIKGCAPLHLATGHPEVVRLLLEAAPGTARLTAVHSGWNPAHYAASRGCVRSLELLLEAAPELAGQRCSKGQLPLALALEGAAEGRKGCWEAARCLLTAGPPGAVLKALRRQGRLATPLYAEAVARRPLSARDWQRVPSGCRGLGAALPAVLARSSAEAARLVARLGPSDRARLEVLGLSLARVQRQLQLPLPPAIVGRLLSLFDAAS
eukprot:scaffold13.g355.t1